MVVLTSFTPPTEGIRLQQANTVAHYEGTDMGKGTLYVAERQLSWMGPSGDGFSLDYPHISLHAVSRDLTAFPHECLLLMLDPQIEEQQTEEDSEQAGYIELRFIPEDKGTIHAMFNAVSACQALHPDPNDSFSDEDIFEDADEDIEMDPNLPMSNLRIRGANTNGHSADGDGHHVNGEEFLDSEND